MEMNVDSQPGKNGSIYKYNYATNEFGIAKSDGTIVTYFKPSTGAEYWIKQKEELEYDK